MSTYDIVQQTYNVGTETAVVWRNWYAITIAEAVLVSDSDNRTIMQYINDRFTELMGEGVPETFDTIKEIADYIESHSDVSTALSEAIANKVDKIDGKGLSTNDYTNEDKDNLAIAIQSVLFTNTTPTPVKHGGIAAGTTFDNVSINEVLQNILYPYVKPNISVNVRVTNPYTTDSENITYIYNGDDGKITNGSDILSGYFCAGATGEFQISATNIAVSNKDVSECTFSLVTDSNQTLTIGESTDTSISGGIAPVKNCTILLSVNDGTSTTLFPIAKLYVNIGVFILNNTEGITEKTEITADDIESVQVGGVAINLSNYANRRIVFVTTEAAKRITDHNGLDVTHLFTKIYEITVINQAGTFTDCIMYISDPVTIENDFLIAIA